MNGSAAADAEAEAEHSVSLKGNIVLSLFVACLAGAGMGPVLGPGLAVCCAGLAGASSFGWGVFLSRVPGDTSFDSSSSEPAGDD